MDDHESTTIIAQKPSATPHGAGQDGVSGGTARIADAQCLSLSQQLAILDESTELPPFGMCMSGLQQRLKHRLGVEIAESAIKACLSPYYDLAEWEDRYITKSLGVEVEEFASADHPPRSPLKEYCLPSGGEEEEDDGDGGDDGGGGGGGGGYGDGTGVPDWGGGTKVSEGAVDLGRPGGGGDGNGWGGVAGDKMQEEKEEEDDDDDEEDEEDEDAAAGAGATGTGEVGSSVGGGGRARSGGVAGGGAAVAPLPAKVADAAGDQASSAQLARPIAIHRASYNAPSSSTGEVFLSTQKYTHGTGSSSNSSQWAAGGGGAVEVDGMEVQ